MDTNTEDAKTDVELLRQGAAGPDKPLRNDKLYGKVDLKWYGDNGFKIHFLDANDEHRNIYIDVNPENDDCP